MFLREICVYASVDVDDEIVERFPSGFFTWFHRETICVADHYTHLISGRVDTGDTAKVVIELEEGEDGIFSPRWLNPSWSVLNLCDVQRSFSFRRYAELSENEKKRMVLEALQETLLWLAKEKRWDPTPFLQAHSTMLAGNLDCQLVWRRKGWRCPDHRYKALVLIDCGLRKVDFWALLQNRQGKEITRKLLGTAIPETGVLGLIDRVVWSASTEFRVFLNPDQFHLPTFWEADFSDSI